MVQRDRGRSARFGDSGEFVRHHHELSGDRTFFSDQEGVARMDAVRPYIERIRGNWRGYNAVPAFVEDFVTGLEFPDGLSADALLDPIRESFGKNRDWADRLEGGAVLRRTADLPLIRLYTHDAAYRTLFGRVNQMYRWADPGGQSKAFDAMTWLVELLSMELFAVSRGGPARAEAMVVYRGMAAERKYFAAYDFFAAEDDGQKLGRRMVSIPLGFHSTSHETGVAYDFFESEDALRAGDDRFNVLWKIHVLPMAEAKLALYGRNYPKSVVSSICATDISAYSVYQESEVLLRGPFFDVIDWRRMEDHLGIPTYELEAVMLDSNRDHISTLELGKVLDPPARKLFNALVRWERSTASAELAETLGRPLLAARYRADAGEAKDAAMAAAESAVTVY